jgi:hypothetical protein
MKSKRHWHGRPVWVATTDGKKHNGTLWWTDETSAVIRENGVAGLVVLPKTAEGSRWGFAEDRSRLGDLRHQPSGNTTRKERP